MKGLKDIILRLHANDCRFVIVGGFGAVTWGSAVTTRDVDVACDMSPANLTRVWRSMEDIHPVHRMTPRRFPFTRGDAERPDWKNLYLSTDIGQIDLLGEVKGIGGFGECLAQSTPITFGGAEIRLLTLDALITAKRAMGRPKDLHTVLELEVIRENLKGR